MLRRLYDWTLSLAGHRRAGAALGLIAFVESSVFPIPPDVPLIAMVLARRERAWRYALIASVCSVLGGLLGYAIGALLFEAVGARVVALYGYQEAFARFEALFAEWGWWLVAGAGFTPFPYKVITIASGVARLDLATFVIASTVARSARFFLVAALLWYFGPAIRDLIERRLALLTTLFFVLLLGGFVLLRFIR